MKINPVAIQSYQQLERRDRPAETAIGHAGTPTVDEKITIAPQSAESTSRLAVKPPSGDYADLLTAEERQALDLLFRRFNDPARFGPGYMRQVDTAGETTLVGRIVDVKV